MYHHIKISDIFIKRPVVAMIFIAGIR